MTGDMTSVPLRAKDRWTSARMQQGRVLLDTDWNLDLDGPARDARQLAADAIGPAGVPTSRQRSRASSCGWSQNSCIEFSLALAISAFSSRSTTCVALSFENIR